jgi:hypothetical protein
MAGEKSIDRSYDERMAALIASMRSRPLSKASQLRLAPKQRLAQRVERLRLAFRNYVAVSPRARALNTSLMFSG